MVGVGTGLLAAGCSQADLPGPKTVPVEGKIVFTKGGTPADLADVGVAIQLQSVEMPDLQAVGEIEPDGSFTVATQLDEGMKRGAVPGKHRVRLNADESGARLVAPRFLEYETSGIQITVPSADPIDIKVWR
jgi:hypothetical protein